MIGSFFLPRRFDHDFICQDTFRWGSPVCPFGRIWPHLAASPLHAGSCSCKDEFDDASAEVTGSCSKVWSSGHCTLKENGASSLGVQRLLQDGALTLTDFENALSPATGGNDGTGAVVSLLLSREQYFETLNNCAFGRAKLSDTEFTTLALDTLMRTSNGDFGFLTPDGFARDMLNAARENRVADDLCTTRDVQQTGFGGQTLSYGAGCFGFGSPDMHVLMAFFPESQCSEMVDF
ncbi:hypothetical protein PGB28_10840 [Primorskyibacter aestuariivivens]|uniref:hypothetical protein n=1 Tax=Primorskyibacter aestuariivivens TaxID=1888912 RepID=UPI0023004544|nr:hypothetical protein [Primorskyibacter aestuariivivens]MDA7428952.1 hypothetical protein [Primorskyibacter aestuariivivens]